MKIITIILVLAVFFRIFDAFNDSRYIDDEEIHVRSAVEMAQYGISSDQQWQFPPLSSIILYSSITLFGDTPLGRRIGNIVFGSITVLLLYLVGLRLYKNCYIAWIAATLLASDPFHAYFSRNSHMEISATFFFLLFLYLVLEFTERAKNTLLFAGIALGFTIATKAYFVFSIPLVIAFAILRTQNYRKLDFKSLQYLFLTLVLLPVSLYLISYFHWFGRGYTLTDFFQMKTDSIRHLQEMTIDKFPNWKMLSASGKPWEWFVKPLVYGEIIYSDEQTGKFLLTINNPPFRLLVIPSIIFLTVYSWRNKSFHELFLPLLFITSYTLFFIVRRPMFGYSSIVVLPFAYLAVARTIVQIASWCQRDKLILIGFTFLTLFWGVYTFPLYSERSVRLSFYKPILSICKFRTYQ